MKELRVEKKVGRVNLSPINLFMTNVDMESLEYWEDRLEKLNEPHAIVYQENSQGKIVYSIYCNIKRKGSCFK